MLDKQRVEELISYAGMAPSVIVDTEDLKDLCEMALQVLELEEAHEKKPSIFPSVKKLAEIYREMDR